MYIGFRYELIDTLWNVNLHDKDIDPTGTQN